MNINVFLSQFLYSHIMHRSCYFKCGNVTKFDYSRDRYRTKAELSPGESKIRFKKTDASVIKNIIFWKTNFHFWSVTFSKNNQCADYAKQCGEKKKKRRHCQASH
jgi:hypothetical protein